MSLCYRLRLAVLIAFAAFAGSTHAAPALRDVRSFLYLVFSGTNSPGIYDSIRAAPHDMIILGIQANDQPLDRNRADPGSTKLIMGYANLSLAASWHNPSLFASGVLPSWFGNQDPDWPGTYSVQYWNPAWFLELQSRIDRLITEGYDGVLLDSATGDYAWM